MGTYDLAWAKQQKWIQIECPVCRTRYAFLAAATGSATNATLPFSKETVMELALVELDDRLLRQAQGVPCPGCGNYPIEHAERVVAQKRRLFVWGLGALVFLLQVGIAIIAVPKAPVWIVFIMLGVAFILPRCLWPRLEEQSDPNHDPDKNLQLAQGKLAKGHLRLVTDDQP